MKLLCCLTIITVFIALTLGFVQTATPTPPSSLPAPAEYKVMLTRLDVQAAGTNISNSGDQIVETILLWQGSLTNAPTGVTATPAVSDGDSAGFFSTWGELIVEIGPGIAGALIGYISKSKKTHRRVKPRRRARQLPSNALAKYAHGWRHPM